MNKILSAVSASAMLFALASNVTAQDVAQKVEDTAEAVAETAKDTAMEVVDGAAEVAKDTAEGAEAVVEAVEGVASEAEVAVEEVVAPVNVDVNQVVAKGDGFEIFLGDVLALKSELPPEYLSQDPAALFPELVNQLVSQEIIAKEADENTEAFKFKNRQAERAIAVNQVLKGYIDENLTDDYLQKTYDDVIGNLPAEQEYNAAHILLETEEDAKAVIEQINAGADFNEVAKEKSTGPSGPEGGDLGWFGPGQMVPEFETAVAALEVGAITAEPVKTQFGFHVIKLNEKREKAKPTREEVDAQLREYATQMLMEQKVTSAREGANVEIIEGIDPAVLSADF